MSPSGVAFADAPDLWCQASKFRATGGGTRTVRRPRILGWEKAGKKVEQA